MLEFGGDAAAQAGDLIKTGSDATFKEDVLDASRNVPVVVDFQTEWCGPCKTLGPALEAAVRKARGAVKLVKIDIDQNPQFAAQLRVQSIPAVFGFVGGQPVDGFMGAVAPSEVEAFVKRLAAQGGGSADGGLTEALDAADEMLAQGAVADAAQTFAAILGEDPENGRAIGGMARAYAAASQIDQAKATLDAAPEKLASDPAVAAARAQIDLAEQTADAGEAADLAARLEADPNDHQARYDIAVAKLAAGDAEGAIEALLDLFRRDRDWSDGAAKAQLFKIFDSLGEKDPLALNGRRRLSSMIFA